MSQFTQEAKTLRNAKSLATALIFPALLCFPAGPANANVVITGTRVIYDASNREVTIRMNNEGQKPALVQAWLDNGDTHSTPDSSQVPFMLSPPLFRVDPGKAQSMRMTYTQEPLPADRESVFWLNVLDIPPRPEKVESGDNTLQLAFRSRLKVFFRPAGLAGSPDDAAGHLQWSLLPAENGSFYKLKIHNPGAYHVTLPDIQVMDGEQTADASGPNMVAPNSDLMIPLKGFHTPAAGNTVEIRYRFINDYGAPVDGRAPLSN